MKTIKSILLAATLLTGGLIGITSCTDYQDEIDSLDYRVRVLEELVNRMNTNLKAMQVIVNALDSADYITNVTETEDGYYINFHHAGIIKIYDGKNGINGTDAQTPNITIEKDPADNQWYWKINGEWLTVDGQRIRANGHDGSDAVSPQVRINPDTGMWEISIDGGKTWTPTGTIAHGKDGEDGQDGNVFITNLYSTTNGNQAYLVIETAGATFMVPLKK